VRFPVPSSPFGLATLVVPVPRVLRSRRCVTVAAQRIAIDTYDSFCHNATLTPLTILYVAAAQSLACGCD